MADSGSIRMADPTRAEFRGRLRAREVRELAARPQLEVLQCSQPVPDPVWPLLDEQFFAARPDVQLRVYGHYSGECDLSFAALMTNVRRFAADCLMRARNVEAIGAMPRLESLSLGIFELEEFRVLESVPATLGELFLGATRSKKPSLAPLERLRSLEVLYLEGQSKGIELLAGLRRLRDLTLRSITTPGLGYLAGLPELRSLDVKLGGIRSFAGIEGKASIQYLEIWQVRGLENVDIVPALPGLQNLFLQSLPRIGSLPSLEDSRALRRVVLQNLKGLQDFSGLESAPALEEFALVEGNRQTPEQLLPVLRNPALRRASAYFGSDRKNRAFARLRDEHGKQDWQPGAFEYR